MPWIQTLKTKWKIKSNWDFCLIMLTFSLSGMMSVFMRKAVFQLFGLTPATPLWVKVCVYIPIFFPLYQAGLLAFGLLLGQFAFFWEKEKKLLQWILGRNKNVKHQINDYPCDRNVYPDRV